MTRTQNILTVVRDRLADAKGERFTDELLLRLLSQQQVLVCSESTLLKTRIVINLKSGQALYSLPDDCLSITRVVGSSNVDLPIVSHSKMDALSQTHSVRGMGTASWEDTKGKEPSRIVFDRISPGNLKVFPIPDKILDVSGIDSVVGFTQTKETEVGVTREDVSLDNIYGEIAESENDVVNVYGVVVDVYWFTPTDSRIEDIFKANLTTPYGVVVEFSDSEISVSKTTKTTVQNYVNNPDFGIVADAEGYTSDVFGFVTSIKDETEQDVDLFDTFGVLAGWSTETEKKLTVYYNKRPEAITKVSQSLEFEDTFDIPLTYFVAAEALLVNQDTESVGRADNFITLGKAAMTNLGKHASSNLASPGGLHVGYHTGFEI